MNEQHTVSTNLHPHFEHISRVGDGAGQASRKGRTEGVRGYMFYGAPVHSVLRYPLLERVVGAELYRAVCRLSEDCGPDAGDEIRPCLISIIGIKSIKYH